MAAPTEFDVRSLMAKGLPYDLAKSIAQLSDPAAITSTAPSAAYSQAEAAAVRNDVIALRTTVLALCDFLQSLGLTTT